MVHLIEAFQITRLEREVAVVRCAQGHGNIGGLVAFYAKPRLDHVDRQRGIGTDDEHEQGGESAGVYASFCTC